MHSRKTILYVAASLDGFIADQEGGIGWLEEYAGHGDYGYQAFLESVDTIVMGRTTYDQVLTFGAWPYAGKQCYVFTHHARETHVGVTFVDGSPAALIEQLHQREGKSIWLVGGAELVQEFIREGLVDELILSIIPVVLGDGIRLFGQTCPRISMTLIDSTRYDQVLQLRYALSR